MKRILFISTLVLGLGLTTVWSQPQPPDDPGDVPIDGGLSLLVASGLGYGVYRYKKAKNSQKDS
ncbi:MAG: hypothetical protein JWO58_1642 [Chitinophagaceae bacterium]|nr:hypothetical protein [Chitinophagaceae bacterium]